MSPDIEDLYTLTPLQQGLLFHGLCEPGRGLYVDQLCLELSGELDRESMAAAWRRVIDRHPVLRSSFHWRDASKPLQVVHRKVELPFAVEDWSGDPPSSRPRRLEAFLAADRSRGFRLDRAPLMRLALIRFAEASHRLVWSFHHVVLDGWSLAIASREVFAFYEAAVRGERLELAPAPPFRAFVSWLRRNRFEGAETFWRRELKGFSRPTPLAADGRFGTGAGMKVRAEEERDPERRLPAALASALGELAGRRRMTLGTLFLGAWSLVLGRTSGEDDVVFGLTVAGRPETLPEVESTVGMFLNTVPFRVRLDDGARVADWLAELQERRLAARPFEHTPLTRAQAWSEVAPGSPLFESILVVENVPPPLTARATASVEVRGSRHLYRTHYALALQVSPGSELALRLAYDRRRFDRTPIVRTLRHLETVLAAFVEDPGRPLASVSLLSAAERSQLEREWNDTRAAYPRDGNVFAAFAGEARRRPDAIALVAERGTASYRRLEDRALRTAGRLRARGVRSETAVGLSAEGGVERVAGILAVLAAGGVCVPLDPDYPAERLAWIAADSGVELVLTGRGQHPSLPPALGARVLVLGEDGAGAAARPAAVAPTGRAFVLYTSGSTGRPKGVEVLHRGILRLVLGNDALPLGAGRTFLQLAPLSFDACFLELWGALLRGGRAVLAGDRRPPPRALGELVRRERVDVLWLTASLFNTVVDEDPEALAAVGWLLIGGEALSRLHVLRVMGRLPATRLMNGYGPTEGTTFTCCHPIAPRDATGPRPISIGRPIAQTRVHVVDRRLRPLPMTAPGELAIGGDGLARGYLGRPRRSAEGFVPDPFAEAPGERLYKSGDRVRYDPWGRLDFLGRFDLQLKVRGFRIEPGEVEAVLRSHPAVLDAAVTAAAPAPGASSAGGLVAYVAARRGATPAALRAFLSDRLPPYMVPARFVLRHTLPLGPTGKVDRAALAEADPGGRAEAAYRAPETPVEELVAGLYAALLGVAGVGADDDFLELGGNSLEAMRLAAGVREACAVDLPLADVLERSTVGRLAARIEELLGRGEAPPLTRAGRGAPLPLSFAQERLWILDRFDPGLPVYNVPLALALDGTLEVPALAAALADLAARHESLRTRFALRGGVPVQEVAPAPEAVLPVVDLGALAAGARAGLAGTAEAVARRLAAAEAVRRFDLTRGPLLRAALLRLAGERHLLLLTLHHIVADEWSLGVLARDLGALYGARLAGVPSPLPALEVQYGDVAAWLRGRPLDELLAFWKARCSGVAPVLELPADHRRPTFQSFAGGRREARLAGELTGRLSRLARGEHATAFMTLLAGFEALLYRLSGQESFFVGTPVANRRRPETRDLIGLLLDTLALPADLSGPPTFRELLTRVRTTTLEAFAHQDLPFERLVEALRPERDLGRSPVFQVLFVVHQEPRPRLELAGLEARAVEMPPATAKFELTLSLALGGAALEAGAIEASLEHALALFDAVTAGRWLAHFETLLASALEDADRPLPSLSLLRPAERHQMLAEWNDSAAAVDAEAGTGAPHVLFETRAEHVPEATAVVFRGVRWSYRHLDLRAGRLACRLRRQGVGPEVVVALAVERAPEMVAAMLAVWKAGGAYLPLDPAYPRRRSAAMLAESRAALLLSSGSRFPPPEGTAPVLRLEEAETWSDAGGGRRPRARPHPEGLAYVIYTSGSTGRPKGVAIRHGSVARLLRWARARYPPAVLGGVLASTSISFDLSVFELFLPLTAGGTVVLAESVLELPDLARGGRVTLVNTVPSALAEVVAGFGLPASVVRVNLAGEPIPPALVEAVHRRTDAGRLANLYGPSEDTTYSTCEPVRPGDGTRAPPIGRPIDGTRAHLFGRRLEEVPAGAFGELWIAGEGLARGYLAQPARTAERFVPDAHGGPGERAYRTGDLARRLADGRLDFAGRLDHQVKLRGFRIELGEIEAALAAHPAVGEALVAVDGERAEARRLVAYVAPRPGAALAGDDLGRELRRFLAESLPDFMLPAAFVPLEALPRTASGKLDRGAVSATEGAAAERGGVFVEPRTELERRIAEVWRQVLGAEAVGAGDHFFSDLGGTSLDLVRAAARLQEELGRPFSVLETFRFPTVGALAEHLSGEVDDQAFERTGARRAERRQRSLASRRRQRRDLDPGAVGGEAP